MSQSFWVCKSNISDGVVLHTGEAKAVSEAFDAPVVQKLTRSLLDEGQQSMDEAPPRDLQHLKCSLGRLNCAEAQNLVAETTRNLEDLDAQARKAEQDNQKLRKSLVTQQGELDGRKLELQQELAEAVSRMSSANELRRSLSEEVRTLQHESRAHRAQCQAAVRTVFETMCALRKIRSSLVSKSGVIKVNDLVDCDVTQWQPGECSAKCDNACPGNATSPCGGESKVTRAVIQPPGAHGMKCPALAKVTVCNQVKCPVNCEISTWSTWNNCSRDCGGGVRSRTRKVLQVPAHGGQACGPPTESKPCNTGECPRSR